MSLALADFNGDGHPDIIAANYASNHASTLLGYGNGSFADQISYSAGLGPVSLGIGDFNNDSRLDMVMVHSEKHLSILPALVL